MGKNYTNHITLKKIMKVEIIAEMAQGFEGDITQTKLLILAAASSGANAVKFQLVYADELATPDYLHYDLFKKLEMSDEEWSSIAKYSIEQNIELYLDVFGVKGLYLCEKIGLKAIKLHPTDITNLGLLQKVSESKVSNIILGVGGANLDEIEVALNILKNKNIDLLLGFQAYPTQNNDNHIYRLKTLKDYLDKKYNNFRIGFADHAEPEDSLKFAIACTAIGAGAKVLEKHLTLGKVMKMEDHESALNPDEFKDFTYIVNQCANSMGEEKTISNDFGMSVDERKYRKAIRRHVVTSKKLTKSKIILAEDVVLKRTSSENVIYDLGVVYNKELTEDIEKNKAININNLK